MPTAPVVPITRRCGSGRWRSSRLSFPAGKATSRCREVRACPQRVLVNGHLQRRLRLRVAEERFVGQLHLLPGTLLPQRNFLEQCGQSAAKNAATDYFGLKRLRRIYLEPREKAVHETLRPRHRCVLAFVFVSHSLLFTLSEVLHHNAAGVQLRYPKSKWSLIFCQALFLKNSIFGSFFA